jgi:hypothetical protein
MLEIPYSALLFLPHLSFSALSLLSRLCSRSLPQWTTSHAHSLSHHIIHRHLYQLHRFMQANLIAIAIFLLSTLQVLALPMELVPRSCKITSTLIPRHLMGSLTDRGRYPECMLSWTPTALSCLKVGMEFFAKEGKCLLSILIRIRPV